MYTVIILSVFMGLWLSRSDAVQPGEDAGSAQPEHVRVPHTQGPAQGRQASRVGYCLGKMDREQASQLCLGSGSGFMWIGGSGSESGFGSWHANEIVPQKRKNRRNLILKSSLLGWRLFPEA